MSVIVKGMEMPKDKPIRIVLNPNGQLFVDHGVHFTEYEAVELPPHGDLVDRSEMREIAISLLDKAVTDQEANAIREMWSHLGQMPTIIEAEDGT